MSVLIVATPLFDNTMTVQAYKLCGHNPEIALDIKGDFREKNQVYYMPALDLVQKIGIEAFSGDLPMFVEANRFHILTGMFSNKNIPHDKLIVVISPDLEADNELLTGLEGVKRLGYSIALDGLPPDGITNPLVVYADHIILSYLDKTFAAQFNEIRRRLKNVQTIIADLPDMEAYNKYSLHKNALFTGSFYNHPITSGSSDISPLKVNALRLMKQINEEDFELKNIAQTIERDPSLSISLLSFINSPAVGLRSKVNSISNAVAILGQKAIQRWATIAISVDIAQDRPSEITKLSLVRAKFAENLAPIFELGIFANSLFMTGLFSMLDVILKKPMAEAVNEIAVDNLVREALVNCSGSLYPILEFIYNYERADWNRVCITLIQNSIDGELVGQAFIDALMWYDQLLVSIDENVESQQNAEA